MPSRRSASGIGRPGDGVVAVALEVRIVDARRRDPDARHLEVAADVRHVEPAALGERRPQVPHGSGSPRTRLCSLSEVLERVLRLGREVVVAAEDEQSRACEQHSAERLHHRGHRLLVRQVVAGVHDEVGFEVVEFAQPVLFQPLSGHHVQVADVQHPQRRRPGREYRHGDLTQDERIAFDQRWRSRFRVPRRPRHPVRRGCSVASELGQTPRPGYVM